MNDERGTMSKSDRVVENRLLFLLIIHHSAFIIQHSSFA